MRVFKNLSKLPKFKNAIITIGTFDGVHKGHQKLLARLKELAKKHQGESVLITFHPHPRFVINPNDKSLKLLNTLDEKISLLEQYELDNLIVAPFSAEFSQMPALDYIKNFLVKNFTPNTIVIGYDHQFGKNRTGDIDLLKQYQKTYHYTVEQISKETLQDIGISSTKIRNALSKGLIEVANSLLGHPYTLSGFIIKGEQLGRTIGFPTANLQLEVDYKLIPKSGAYAVFVKIENKSYKGMLNIGYRPTVEGQFKTIEVNIFNFNQDIYGEKIELQLIQFIREESKFENIDLLKKQLKSDYTRSNKILDQYIN